MVVTEEDGGIRSFRKIGKILSEYAPSLPRLHYRRTAMSCLWVVTTQWETCRKRILTGGTVRGSNPGGVEVFRTCPERP